MSTLVGPNDEKARLRDAVEAGPVEGVERRVELARDRGQRGNPVVLAIEQMGEPVPHVRVSLSTGGRLARDPHAPEQ